MKLLPPPHTPRLMWYNGPQKRQEKRKQSFNNQMET